MSVAADLDALIANFSQYGDLITTSDDIDRLQRVIIDLSNGTLNPPNDALGQDCMNWICRLIKYLETQVCPPPAPCPPCPNVGPELIPGGAVYADDGLGNPVYVLAVTAGANYLIGAVTGLNGQIYTGAAGQGVTLQSPGTFTAWFDSFQITPTGSTLTIKPKSGVNVGDAVVASVKQLI